MAYARPLLRDLLENVGRRQPVLQVLVGPRQVGKTTLAKQLIAKVPFPAVYASADAPLPPGPEWIETQWRVAVVKAQESRKPVLLVLDEAQKVRGWSETVKRLWDARDPSRADLRLLVLGSSALLLQEGLAESLAGRFFLYRCTHWPFSECRQAFGWDLRKWVFFGGYPGSTPFVNRQKKWKQYITDSLIETVIARDVLQLERITKPPLLRHLFALSAAYPAQVLSYNKMLGQLQDAGNTTTLAHYLTLLDRAFLVSGLDLFSRGRQRRRGSSPKLVLWNNALISALSLRTFSAAVADTAWWGRLVENAVGAHLLNGLSPTVYSVTYWRKGDREVDFVVQTGDAVWPLEVKSGRSGRMSGLQEFRERYPASRPLVIGGEGIPLEEFLGADPETWFQ